MEFRVLGPVEARQHGRELPLGGPKQRALLAILLLRDNKVVSRDHLIDHLWGEHPPASAAHTLDSYVSRLRKALGDGRLSRRPPGYVLRVEPGELDLDRFERLSREGREAFRRGAAEEAVAMLRSALGLWNGAAFAGVELDSSTDSELRRFEELRLDALEERIEAELAIGRDAEVVAELEALVAEHPFRERLRRELMLALYRCDRQAEALEVYRDGRRRLVEDLGIEPSPPLRELERAILGQDPSLEAPPPPAAQEGVTTAVGRRRHRSLLVLAAAFAVAGTIAIVVAAFAGGGSSVTVPPNEVGVIDPSTNRVTDAVPVGSSPGGVAVDESAVWVANRDDETVTRLNPRTHELEKTIVVHGTPTGLAAGGGALWVAHGYSGTLERIDARYNQVSQRIPVLPSSAAQTSIITGTVALGPRAVKAVWVAYSDSTVARIDTQRDGSRISARGNAGYTPAGIAVSGRAVWVANFNANTVSRLDPRSLEPATTHPINVGKGPSGIAVGGGAVWVADSFDDSVSRIDPLANASTSIRVGVRPVAIAFGYGSVWVANGKSGTVSRIDPRSQKVVDTITVGHSPAGIAVGDGRVWVAVRRS